MHPTHIFIDILQYKTMVQCNKTYEGSMHWDELHGIELDHKSPEEWESHPLDFKFRIKDPQRFMVLQLKHGI